MGIGQQLAERYVPRSQVLSYITVLYNIHVYIYMITFVIMYIYICICVCIYKHIYIYTYDSPMFLPSVRKVEVYILIPIHCHDGVPSHYGVTLSHHHSRVEGSLVVNKSNT